MVDFRNRRFHAPDYARRRPEPEEQEATFQSDPSEGTGSEATDLKALVESRAPVVVVLHSGERMRGRIRYYDRDCFSLGPAGGGPKIFLRKDSVRYIAEE